MTRSDRSLQIRRDTKPPHSVQIVFMASRCSVNTCQRRLGGTPGCSISSLFQPAPTPKRNRPFEIRSKEATRFACAMGSCSVTSETPVPSLSVVVTATAAANPMKGSDMWMYSVGNSPPPGNGVRRLAGIWVRSGNQRDSKPRSSHVRANSSASIVYSVLKVRIPNCILLWLRTPALKILAVRLSSLFDLFDRHLHPQRFQLSHQSLALPVYMATVEVVAAQVRIARPALQDVIGAHQNPVAHGYERFLLAPPFHQAFVRRRQRGPFLRTGCPGGLHQRGPQVATAFGCLAALALACRFVVAWTHPGPTGQVVVSGKALHVYPDLSYDDLRHCLPDAGDRVQQLHRFRHERGGAALHLLCDPRCDSGNCRFALVILLQQPCQNPPLGLGQAPRQRLLQLGLLALARPAGHVAHLLRSGLAR